MSVTTRIIVATDYLDQLIMMGDSAFGKGYLTSSDFIRSRGFIIGAFIDDELVGFIFNYFVDIEDSDQYYFVEQFIPSMPILYVKSIVVSPEFQRRGIARLLLDESIRFSDSRGVNFYYGYAWLVNGDAPFGSVFISCGFRALMVKDRLWYNDSLNKQYHCTICGDPPCCCSAVLFVNSLSNPLFV